MPRRALTSVPASPDPANHAQSPSLLTNLIELRRQWKWAAFCQFFFTFRPLFASNDITITVSTSPPSFESHKAPQFRAESCHDENRTSRMI